MPAILVAAGGYSLLGGAAAAGGGWALFAAGTMVVSGIMARKAEIDGNKDAAAGWMAVGTIASLGASFAKPDPSITGTIGSDSAQQSGMIAENAAAGDQASMLAQQTNIADAGTAMSNTGAATKAASDGGWIEAMAAKDARMAEIASNNLKVQAGAGLATAAVAWQSGEEQAKIKREALEEERRLSDRQYANTNNLTELKVQTPTNLPNLMGSARRQGLINATATTVK